MSDRVAGRALRVAAGALLMMAVGNVAHAQLASLCRPTYAVTTTLEGDDAEALCWLGDSCTLRAAMNTAAICRDYGAQTVLLPPDAVFSLTRADVAPAVLRLRTRMQLERVGPTGLPRVFGAVVLRTAGEDTPPARQATIRRDDLAPPFRLLHVAPGGVLTIDRVKLQNGATAATSRLESPPARGAGVYNEGRLILRHAEMSGHRGSVLPPSRGGAVFNTGYLQVTGGTFSDNDASEGAAVSNAGGEARITLARIVDNRSVSRSARSSVFIVEGGSLSLGASIVDANDVDGAPVSVFGGSVLIDATTVSNNQGRLAGALALTMGDVLLKRSTFDANRSTTGGAGALRCLGRSNRLRLVDVTVTRNALDVGGFGAGGLQSTCTLEASNSLLANNAPVDCALDGTAAVSGRSVDSDGSCRGFAYTFAAPMLEDLALVGGPTPTRRPARGSPLIGAGTACGRSDQRGFARSDGHCDVGAVERVVGDGLVSGPRLPPGDPVVPRPWPRAGDGVPSR